MAIEDPTAHYGLRLVIEDYPYAIDGLDVWFAIKTWFQDYCSFYYKSDDVVQNDCELQSWWKELVEVGHGDKKDEPWWPGMQTCDELIESCTIIIWIASALHAAVSNGLYPYGGYILNRPSSSKQYMPEINTPEYDEFEKNPEKAFLKIMTPVKESITNILVALIMKSFSSKKTDLGHRDNLDLLPDEKPLEAAFESFRKRLGITQNRIERHNRDGKHRNRYGPLNVPYTLIYPDIESGWGQSGKGIPNRISQSEELEGFWYLTA